MRKNRIVYLNGAQVTLGEVMRRFPGNKYELSFDAQGNAIPAKRSKPDTSAYAPNLKPLRRDKKQGGRVPLNYPDGNIYRLERRSKCTN